MECEYIDLCHSYLIQEQHKLDKERQKLLGDKKNLLYYLKNLKYKKERVRKPDCDAMCWVHLEIERDKKKNNRI